MSVITYRRSEKTRSILSYVVWFLLTLVTFVIGNVLAESGTEVRLFDWQALVVILVGFIFIGFQSEAGFPEALQRTISNAERWRFPFCYGLLFAAADILVFKVWLHPHPYEVMPSFLQPFPYSVLIYTAGALYTEIYHRLIVFTAVMYLAHQYLPARYHTVCFWGLAVLTSLFEPLMQLPEGSVFVLLYSFVSGFLFNLMQAMYYRRSGIIASVSMRLGHYFLWHILLGIYVQFFEAARFPG